MPARRRLKTDFHRADLQGDVVLITDTYNKIGSISTERDGQWQMIALSDEALDDLYEALKSREAHKQFLAAKYGTNS